MLQHNGRDIFLTGVNLGNVQLLPFEGNPYGLPAAELRSLVNSALAEIAATGANSVRFWLHIDGSRSPSWGIDQVRMPGHQRLDMAGCFHLGPGSAMSHGSRLEAQCIVRFYNTIH
jgi:hypothetical protein